MSHVAVVTGSTSGVGRAVVREFASKGYDLGLIARGKQALEAASKEVERSGGRSSILECDVSDPDAVKAAAERVENELGPIDVWVNNAMTTVFGEFRNMNAKDFKRATDVTYLGSVYGTMAALQPMLRRDRGTIVQVGSALAYRGIPLQTAYCASKHALQGFMESLRCELMHDKSNVKVISVHLPGINTPQFDHCKTLVDHKAMPVPPIYQPEVCARAIVWAAEHPHRREMWVGGSTVATIVANYLAPGLLDRYLARSNEKAQQRPEQVDPNQPVNLWDPSPGDPGAHGSFDDQAHPRSLQAWMSRNKQGVLAGAAVTLGGIAAGILRSR